MQENEKLRLIGLMVKKISGTLSESEDQELLDRINADPSAEAFAAQFTPAMVTAELQLKDEIDTAAEWNRFSELAGYTKQKPVRPMVWRIVAAAVIVLILSGASYLLLKREAKTPQQEAQLAAADILPPDAKAVLTLDDGSSLILDNSNAGNIALKEQGVESMNDAELRYQQLTGGGKLTFNTISTPRGASYKLVLPDGTRVWLNTASSVRFPTSFSGGNREVTVSGEVYFEVAGNKLNPFVVHMKELSVEVLGTSFNVEAWPEKQIVNTTLISGAVKVVSAAENVILKPGQQARTNQKTAVINNIDTDQVMAWKENRFLFRGNSIHEIMDQLARYYDIEVQFKENVSTSLFVGSFSRNSPLSQILEFLEKTGAVHFRVENRKVTVLP